MESRIIFPSDRQAMSIELSFGEKSMAFWSRLATAWLSRKESPLTKMVSGMWIVGEIFFLRHDGAFAFQYCFDHGIH
jgi:hypothetical protein